MDDIRRYGINENEVHTLFDSAGRNEKYTTESEREANRKASQNMDKAADIINELQDSKKKSSLGIWSEMRSASDIGVYSQRALQSLINVKENEKMISYDIEALGTPAHLRKTGSANFFSPTEIALQKGIYKQGQLRLFDTSQSAVSMLIKPNAQTMTEIGKAIRQLETSGWIGMSQDMKRTLADLTAYAGKADELFRADSIGSSKYTSVLKHNPKVSSLASLGMKDVIDQVKLGFQNLQKHGTAPEQAISVLNRFVGNKQARLVGYNIYNYDQQALTEFFNGNVAKNNPNSKINKAIDRLNAVVNNPKNIDLLHANRTVTANPLKQYGANMTLENTHEVLGFKKKGTAHHGLTDVGMTADIFGHIKQKVAKAQERVQGLSQKPGVDKMTQPFYWNNKPLYAGQEVYAFSGVPSYTAGQYDGVFKKNDEGKLEKLYGMKQNPVYARSVYKVDNFFDGVNFDGVPHYGVQLSTDEGTVHTLFRQSKDDLAKILQGNFTPVGKDGIRRSDALALQNEDRASRRYNKMFEIGNGGNSNTGYSLMSNMYGNLEETAGMSNSERREYLKTKYGQTTWLTDSYLRDLEVMAPRLEAEKKIWKPFMEEAEALAGNEQRTIALSAFRDKVKSELGENRTFMQSGGEPYVSLSVGKKNTSIHGWDKKRMVSNIRGLVEQTGENVGRPNRGAILQNFNELVENNLQPMFETVSARSKKEAQSMSRQMKRITNDFQKNVMEGKSVYTAYEEVAGMIQKYMGMGHVYLGGYERERMSMISPAYAQKLQNFDASKDMMRSAINSTGYYGKGLDELLSGNLSSFFDKQRQAITGLIEGSGLQQGLYNYNPKMLDQLTGLESKVKNLAQDYMNKGFRVQLMDAGKRGLALGIMDKDAPESLARKGYAGLMTSNQAAVIHLPQYAEGGKVRWRNQEHVGRFIGGLDKTGRLTMSTVLDQAFESLSGLSSTFEKMRQEKNVTGEKNFFIQAQTMADKRVRKVLERSPMDYNLGYNEAGRDFEVRSSRANFNRAMSVDTSGFAEQWYREQEAKLPMTQAKKLGFYQSADQIAKQASEEGRGFFELMHFNARNKFNSEVNMWLQNRHGLNVSSHGVNDRHMGRGYRSLGGGDPRMQSAFGAFDPTSGENRLKSLNYYGLDKTKVSNVLKRNGESDALVRRRTHYGTVTEVGDRARGTDTDGISMRAAYMTDNQLQESFIQNTTAIKKELADALGSGDISPDEFKKYSQMLEAGKLSTYEGMSIMSKEFQSAFDIVRDVRVKMQDGYHMDERLLQSLESHAKINGMEFDVNKSIDFGKTPVPSSHLYHLMKGGELTVGRMTTDETTTIGLRKSYEGMTIKGWDAETKTLLMGQLQKGDEAMKTVTNTGRRHTETFLPQRVVEILAGQKGVEAIVPEFGQSKRMYGAHLEERVRGYEDELIRQLHGASPQGPAIASFLQETGYTVGKMTVQEQVHAESEALEKLLLPHLRENLGLDKDQIRAVDGRIMVDSHLGFGDNGRPTFEEQPFQIRPEAVKKLDETVGAQLGYDFRKDGIQYGQVIKQRHDVWADQTVVGKGAPDGKVRLGMKEIRALEQHATEMLGMTPEQNTFVRYLKGEVSRRASNNEAIRDVGQYTLNALTKNTPQAGDIVFDTSAMRPGMQKVNGKEINGVIQNGMLMVNPESALSLPQVTAKDTKIISDEYVGTLLDTNRLKVNYQDENGRVVSSDVKSLLRQNGEYKGTAYLRLPDDSFGQTHLPLIDFETIGRQKGDGGYLNELQKTQRNIIDDVTRYNALGANGQGTEEELAKIQDKLRNKITRGVDNYQKQVSQFITSGSESSFLNQTSNAKMDMSGHFRAQSVNPFAMYSVQDGKWKNTGAIKENVAYISKNDFKGMIDGAEDNILKAWGKEGMPNFKDIKEKQSYILDNVNEKGLYGTTIRYPIINASTAQTMKFEVADWASDKSMHVGIGSTARIAGDYDGDIFAGMLTSYKSEHAGVYHEQMSKLYEKEQVSSQHRGASLMDDMVSGMKSELMGAGKTEEEAMRAIEGLQKQGVYSISDLSKEGFDDHTVNQMMRAKTTVLDDIETSIARSGKDYIGHIDNARQRISTLHDITTEVLREGGRIGEEEFDRQRAVVNEVTRRLSQDSISSKKFTVGTLVNQEELAKMNPAERRAKLEEVANKRNEKLSELRTQLYRSDMNVDTTIGILRDIGVVNGKDVPLEVGIGRQKTIKNLTDETLFRQGLEQIKRTNLMNAHVGGYEAMALKVGTSKGSERVQDLLNKGDGFVPSQAMKEIYANMSSDNKQRFDQWGEDYRANVLRQHDQNVQAEEFGRTARGERTELQSTRHMLDGSYLEENSASRFRDVVGKVIPDKMKINPAHDGAFMGAAAFTAMWAMSSLMRSGPTPEGLREQAAPPPVSADRLLTNPTARVVENNGEYINLQISAKDANRMSHQDVSAIVNRELQSQAGMTMNMNMNVNDNTQNIDQQWLQNIVAKSMNNGYAFGSN